MTNTINATNSLATKASEFKDSMVSLAGKKAIGKRDAYALERLLKDNPVSAFVKQFDIDEFFNHSHNALALETLEWLYKNASQMINPVHLETLFKNCARMGKLGIPILKWLLDNVGAQIAIVVKSVYLDFVIFEGDQEIIEFLLDNAIHLVKDSLNDSFHVTLKKTNEAMKKAVLIWEKTPQYYFEVIKKYAEDLITHACSIENGSSHLNWLAERLFLLQGTYYTFSPESFVFPRSEESLQGHFLMHGYKWDVHHEAPTFRVLKAHFKTLFEQMRSDGLPFFQRMYEQIPEKLSPYNLRWAFLKAAVSGEKGKALMVTLWSKEGKKLSYWTYKRAAQLAEKNNLLTNAVWLENLANEKKAITPIIADEDDMKLLLATSQTPSGYHALGEAPKRIGWIPLTEEELQQKAADNEPILADLTWSLENNLVPDTVQTCALNEIRMGEAVLFGKLFTLIKEGLTPLKIEGDDKFKEKVLGYMGQLMSRPSGRWALLSVCRSNQPLYIKTGPNEYHPSSNTIYLDEDKNGMDIYLIQGEKTTALTPMDSIFYHELMHALHAAIIKPIYPELCRMAPWESEYDNLEEQLTIAGVDTECEEALPVFALNQNVYNYERNYMQRFGHLGAAPQFLSLSSQELEGIFSGNPVVNS